MHSMLLFFSTLLNPTSVFKSICVTLHYSDCKRPTFNLSPSWFRTWPQGSAARHPGTSGPKWTPSSGPPSLSCSCWVGWKGNIKFIVFVARTDLTDWTWHKNGKTILSVWPFICFIYEVRNFLEVFFGINNHRLRLGERDGSKHFFEVWHPVHCRNQSLQRHR